MQILRQAAWQTTEIQDGKKIDSQKWSLISTQAPTLMHTHGTAVGLLKSSTHAHNHLSGP